jgi:hypothetical protein
LLPLQRRQPYWHQVNPPALGEAEHGRHSPRAATLGHSAAQVPTIGVRIGRQHKRGKVGTSVGSATSRCMRQFVIPMEISTACQALRTTPILSSRPVTTGTGAAPMDGEAFFTGQIENLYSKAHESSKIRTGRRISQVVVIASGAPCASVGPH